jgi:hypothetical protein
MLQRSWLLHDVPIQDAAIDNALPLRSQPKPQFESRDGLLLFHSPTCRTAKMWNCSNPSAVITFASEQQQQQQLASGISGSTSSRGSADSSKRMPTAALGRSSSSSGGAVRRSSGNSSSGSSTGQQGFLSEVTAAQFFYVDQFVLLATGSKLHLYRYDSTGTCC